MREAKLNDAGKWIGFGTLAVAVGFGLYYLTKGKGNPSFELQQPTANPEIIDPGQTTTITAGVKNISNKEQIVDVKMDIYQAGKMWLSGGLIDTHTVHLTIAAGQTGQAVCTTVGTTGGPTNSAGANMRAVGISTYVGGALIGKPWEADDVFGVQVGAGAISMSMLNPILSPTDIPAGSTCNITCPVRNNGTIAVTIHSKVRIVNAGTDITAEGGMLPVSANQTIQPGATANFHFSWVAGATLGGKWLIESIYMSTGELTPYAGPNNPNIFKQTFNVKAPDIGQIIQKVGVTYSTPSVGSPITANVTIKNLNSVSATVELRLDIRNDSQSFATWQEGGEPDNHFDSFDIGGGQTLTCQVQSIPVPSDWLPGDSLSVQVILNGVNGSWDLKSGLVIGVVGGNFGVQASNPPFTITTKWMLYYYSYSDGTFYGDQVWHGIEEHITFANKGRGYLAAFCMGGPPYYDVSPQYTSNDFTPVNGVTYTFNIVG